eukprot:6375308-Prorocentrum_lima.AAC.1
MEELRMLEAHEKAAASKKYSWKVGEAALGNVAAVDQKGDMRKMNNTNSNTSYTIPKAPPCKFFMRTGKCRCGEKCKFAHDTPPDPSSTSPPPTPPT